MPHTFADTEGRKWTLRLTGYTLKLLKSEMDLDVGNPDTLGEAFQDDDAILNILELLCRDKIEERELTEKSFWDAFDGDTIVDATESFISEYQDFFRKRSPVAAKLMKKGWDATKRLEKTLDDKAEQLLAGGSLDKQLDEKIAQAEARLDEELNSIFGPNSTDSPDSSESTPIPLPTANSA